MLRTDDPHMTVASADPVDVALGFLKVWEAGDIDRIMAYFAPQAIYHNVPVVEIQGTDKIKAVFQTFLELFETSDFEVLSAGCAPGVAFLERIDHFVLKNGKRVTLPVTGVFVIEDGMIIRFSDYFDLNDFESQSGISL